MRHGRCANGFAAASMLLAACGSGAVEPAPLDTRATTCRVCRMPVSDRRLAFQLAAPGEEPVFFDDASCVKTFFSDSTMPRGGVLFVTDHRTGAWVTASTAVFTIVPDFETPMGSHVIAHQSAASRDRDGTATGGRTVDASAAIGLGASSDGLP